MTDIGYSKMTPLSDDAIIRKIGAYIKNERLEQNLTQQALAEKAGINRSTLSELELGRRCQLLTLIQVLRILNRLYLFDLFEIEKKISPMMLAEMEITYRKRARRKNKDTNQPKSDW